MLQCDVTVISPLQYWKTFSIASQVDARDASRPGDTGLLHRGVRHANRRGQLVENRDRRLLDYSTHFVSAMLLHHLAGKNPFYHAIDGLGGADSAVATAPAGSYQKSWPMHRTAQGLELGQSQ